MTGEEGYTVRVYDRYTIDSWSRRHTGQTAFLFGLFVGAGVALLFSSMSGKEVREKLIEGSKSLTDHAVNYYLTARHSVTDVVEKGRTAYNQAGPALATAIEAAKQAYASEKGRVTDEIVRD